ncbi:hypothetical protein [Azospirillum sp. ST 5-10]|uniref:hypothetical protein n=1 Tax=unclassified Azospirillum TaxID=2630922 RepID=UPI003F49C7F3
MSTVIAPVPALVPVPADNDTPLGFAWAEGLSLPLQNEQDGELTERPWKAERC